MGNAESAQVPRRHHYHSAHVDSSDSSSWGKHSTTCDETDPNGSTTTTSSPVSLTDQSVVMVGKLLSGGVTLCGSLNQVVGDDGDDGEPDAPGSRLGMPVATGNNKTGLGNGCLSCAKTSNSTPVEEDYSERMRRQQLEGALFLGPEEDSDDEIEVSMNSRRGVPNESSTSSAMSRLFARALMSEVGNNSNSMNLSEMAEREKRLLKAQEKAREAQPDGPRPIGAPGGIAPNGIVEVVQNLRLRGEQLDFNDISRDNLNVVKEPKRSVIPPGIATEPIKRADTGSKFKAGPGLQSHGERGCKHTVTIAISLSRKHSAVGHPDTITRQTAFDFNELQDRNYKYVSSTDSNGWLAGGGESADGPMPDISASTISNDENMPTSSGKDMTHDKIAAPDIIHIPLLHIDCNSEKAIEQVIKSLGNGEVFIPHMSVLPESLCASGSSPPDLVLRFGCERSDGPPDEWPNWELEFMHNQLYEYFLPLGARWEERPFQLTLARKVRFKSIKHMNKYFAHCESVMDTWRERGPQYLDPQLPHFQDGATTEEVARPHGIYLYRNGRPTNYFPPNFDRPYSTKMTRALLLNVINKSWDKQLREWSSAPIPQLVTPAMLLGKMCGCSEGNQAGFIATEATLSPTNNNSTSSEYHVFADSEFDPFDFSTEYDEFRRHSDSSGAVLGPNSPLNVSDMPTEDKMTVLGNSADFPTEASEISQDSSNADDAAVTRTRSSTGNDIFGARSNTSMPIAPSQITNDSMNFLSDPKTCVQPHGPEPPSFKNEIQYHSMQHDVSTEVPTLSSSKSKKKKERKKERERIRAIAETIQRQELESLAASSSPRIVTQLDQLHLTVHDATHLSKSIGESQSTQIINNKSAPRIIESERERRRQSKVEREKEVKRVEALEMKLKEKRELEVKASQTKSSTVAVDEQKVSREMKKAGLEASDGERSRRDVLLRNMLIAEAQEETRKARELMASHEVIRKTPSGDTLEYSVDSSSILREGKANGRLSQTSTGETTYSYSTMESTSTADHVPSDEELFAVGWAKALDVRTGANYYFTLDRSKTAWKNPLKDYAAL